MSKLFNYGTQGIIVGSTVPYIGHFEAVGGNPINGVQSSTVTLNYPRQEIMDWAGGGEPVLVQRPRAQLQFSYIFSNGQNEANLGFALGNFLPALSNVNNERNYYILINQDNHDQIGYTDQNNYVMSFGNGLVTRYDFRAQVGQPSICDVSIEALNLLIQGTGTGQAIPAVFKQSGTYPTGTYTLPTFTQQIQKYFEAAPSNINIVFDTGSTVGAALSGQNSCPLQSFDFSIDMTRSETKDIGWAYPNTRSIHWPLTITIHADAYLNGFQVDALNRLTANDSGWNFNISFNSGFNSLDAYSFQFNGAKLDSQTFTAQIGASNKVSFNWTCKIYDINRTSGANFFMPFPQIAYSSIIFSGVNWGTGVGQAPLVVNLSQPSYLSILAGAGVLYQNMVEMLNEAGQVTIQLNVSGTPEVDLITATII